MKYLSIFTSIFVLVACKVEIEHDPSVVTQSISDDMASAIDTVFNDISPDGAGGALAVVQDGEIVYATGYGLADLEHDVPITPQSVFYIGSVSKQFVTFSILQLVEEDKLFLDDDVRKYIPEFPDYGVPLTIRHFIHHTSGVRDYLTLWEMAGYDYLDKVPKQAVIDIICRQKELNFEPGSRYMYSNSCYFMLALIIERVTGQTMAEYGEEKIFGPLGMTSSRFHDNNRKLIEDRAFSYFQRPWDSEWENIISRFDLVGSGGIYSTVEDLAKWDQNLYENKIGSQSLLDTLKTDGKLNDGSSAEYAFAVKNGNYRGLKTLGHSGALAGYRSHFLQFPDERTSIILLGNRVRFDPSRRAYEIADIVLADRLGDRESEEEGASGNREQESFDGTFFRELPAVAGRYYSEELDTYYVIERTKDGDLELLIRYNRPLSLSVSGERTLRAQGARALEFESANAFRVQYGRVQNLLFKRVN